MLRLILSSFGIRHIAAPLRKIARFLARTSLGCAYTQIVPNRQRHIMRGFIMLQIIDDVVVASFKYFVGAGRVGINDCFAIHGRQRVRHDQNVGVSAGSCRAAARNHGFLVGLARIAVMDMGIGKARGQRQTGSVDVIAVGEGVAFLEQGCCQAGYAQVNDFAGVPHREVAQRDHSFASSSQ